MGDYRVEPSGKRLIDTIQGVEAGPIRKIIEVHVEHAVFALVASQFRRITYDRLELHVGQQGGPNDALLTINAAADDGAGWETIRQIIHAARFEGIDIVMLNW